MIDLAPLLQKKLTPRCEGKFLFQRKDDMFSWKNSGTTSPSYDSWNCPGMFFNYKGFGMIVIIKKMQNIYANMCLFRLGNMQKTDTLIKFSNLITDV